MRISHIYYHPQFERSFFNLPRSIQKTAEKKIIIFRDNPFSPSLRTHKLKGKLKEHWSFMVKARYRVIFIFDNSDVILLDIGPHDIYK